MLRVIFNKLEDPNIPLLGPNIKLLKLWGLLIPKSVYMRFVSYILNGLVVVFVATQYADVWLVRANINLLLNNLKTSMVSTVNVFKVSMFLLQQMKWRDLLGYISNADNRQRLTKDPISKDTIIKSTNYCRRVTYTYLLLTFCTALSLILQPLSKYAFSSTYRANLRNGSEPYIDFVRCWVPFDKTKLFGYLLASIYQIYATFMVAGYISSFDTTVIVTMVFFKTELMLLQRDSSKVIVETNENNFNVYSRIIDCHRRHVELVKYAKIFNSCLSPVMFLYVIVCSIMLCASAYQITIENDAMQRLLTAEYLVFGIAQLFMYCWHSNEVIYASQNLDMGPYQSMWYNQGVRFQKDVNLLSRQFNKKIIFKAGPFTVLTISTFINIIKGAYSYYTLIN